MESTVLSLRSPTKFRSGSVSTGYGLDTVMCCQCTKNLETKGKRVFCYSKHLKIYICIRVELHTDIETNQSSSTLTKSKNEVYKQDKRYNTRFYIIILMLRMLYLGLMKSL